LIGALSTGVTDSDPGANVLNSFRFHRRMTSAICRSALLASPLVWAVQVIPAHAADAPTPAVAPRPVVRAMADLAIDATIKVGKTADWVAITAGKVWVGSTGPNAVNEIDPKTNTVFSIALPGRPCAGLSADRHSIWIPLCGPTPQLAQIDQKTRRLAKVFPVGPPAGEGSLAIGAGSLWLVTDKTGSLARIDPATGEVIHVIQLPAGSYNPVFAKGMLWVTHVDGADVSVVDPRTNSVVSTVAVGPNPRFTAAGAGAVWTLNQGDGTLSRINAKRREAAPPQPLETPGHGGDVAFFGGRVWTTMMRTPLTASDARTGLPLCQWKGEGGDSLNVGHGAVWLTNLRSGTVSRIPLAKLPPECGGAGK
jgi:YVTN family beta-propeller protein